MNDLDARREEIGDEKNKKGTPTNDHRRASALEIEFGLDSKDLSGNKRLDSKDVNCGLNDHRGVKHEAFRSVS